MKFIATDVSDTKQKMVDMATIQQGKPVLILISIVPMSPIKLNLKILSLRAGYTQVT
jgi:hypothetical protein